MYEILDDLVLESAAMWGWMVGEARRAACNWNWVSLRSMGGGPRTFPGGVNKWKWKRMHEKLARDKQNRLIQQEKQLYPARIRSHIRSSLSPDHRCRHSPPSLPQRPLQSPRRE